MAGILDSVFSIWVRKRCGSLNMSSRQKHVHFTAEHFPFYDRPTEKIHICTRPGKWVKSLHRTPNGRTHVCTLYMPVYYPSNGEGVGAVRTGQASRRPFHRSLNVFSVNKLLIRDSTSNRNRCCCVNIAPALTIVGPLFWPPFQCPRGLLKHHRAFGEVCDDPSSHTTQVILSMKKVKRKTGKTWCYETTRRDLPYEAAAAHTTWHISFWNTIQWHMHRAWFTIMARVNKSQQINIFLSLNRILVCAGRRNILHISFHNGQEQKWTSTCVYELLK